MSEYLLRIYHVLSALIESVNVKKAWGLSSGGDDSKQMNNPSTLNEQDYD